MREILISDITLDVFSSGDKPAFTFREKIEVAKLLDRLSVSTIELGKLSGNTADTLLIKSVASFVRGSTLAVCPGFDPAEIESVWEALKEAAKPRLQVCAAASTARMEYVYHKKADGMLETVVNAVKACREKCENVEFIAEDATRADFDFLCRLVGAAIENGAGTVTVSDTAGVMLPDEFASFIERLFSAVPALRNVVLGVRCSDALHVATASAATALQKGAGEIKVTSLAADSVTLSGISMLLSAKADALGVRSSVRTTEINRILGSIEKLLSKKESGKSPFEDGVRSYPEKMGFSRDDSIETIARGAEALGYFLDDKDKMRVWKAFCEVAARKDTVSAGELDAIIASEAMQVPPTYTLENFVVTTGNAIDILAHVKLRRGEEILNGLSLGDGPIDAAFLAIEQITGHHYELDDFQIQAVSEGREAMGQTIVKLRSGGKIYSGKGISTDIIGSGVAAYINALNKIIYEEENA